ncbi:EF hand protein (macronuclear) [Tetrahymena thermophila SB210]|uniref:EF hand protein n=1 Tax=Tetrahymena thermophila (strain SB210) TaxID=312017 RepID=Q22DL9_TETTS|nr:EF hand protein [Tetrahymena thermophila SB210]EAR83435.2 EF hand protein [Tetrahymena thermophila SB210]|eukprot:XP_001031098.2 EF hand protein [Tetrahymena thermophila SB210]
MILMGSRTQKRLAALLMQLIENENKVEHCRLCLFKNPNIDLFKVFQQIDVKRKGFFKNEELLDFLCKNNIYATTREVKFLTDQLDTDKDSIVTYDNFLHFLAPQQDENLRKEILVREKIQATQQIDEQFFHMNDNTPTPQKMKQSNLGASAFLSTAKSKYQYSGTQQLNQSFHKQQDILGVDPETEYLLSKLFYQIVQNFKAIEAKKEILNGSNDFQLEVAFKTIDSSNIDKLDYESIEEFLKKHNYQIQEKDLLVLIRTYGSLADGFINQAQFMDMVLSYEFNLKKNAVKASFAKQTKMDQNINQIVQKADPLVDPSKRQVNFGQKVDSQDEQNQSNSNKNTTGAQSTAKIGIQSNENKSMVMTQTKLTNDVYLKQNQTDSNSITIKKPLCRGTLKTPYSKRFLSTVQVRPGMSSIMNINTIEADAEEYDEVYRGKYRNSAMKGDEEEFFVKKLYEIVLSDIKLEEYKQELSTQKDFNLLDSFYFIDLQGKGYITQQDLHVNLKQIGLNPTKDQIYLFFKQYDLDFSNRLEFSEFVKTFIPIDQEYRNILNNRAATGNGFSSQTKHLLKETFQYILQNAYEMEFIRQNLNRRRLFNTYDAFCAIDQDSNGFITLEDIRTLFLDYDIHFSPKELYYFFRRFDKGLDGEVCYGEFFSELTPKSPYTLTEELYTQTRKSMVSISNIENAKLSQ